ncbi:hypothetical protein ACLMJK_009222 [Lecanora helva]
MPFIPNTPESLLSRSDSKDPATTCKGLTASGRPCRRPLGLSPQASPTGKRKSKNGVVAVLESEDDEHDGAAAFFCWQHQDQADTLVSVDRNDRKANIVPVQKRTSIDTLVDRLGVLDVDEETTSKKKRDPHVRVARKDTLPRRWQDMDGPLLAVNSGRHRAKEKNKKPYKSKERSNLGLFCCIKTADSDPSPPPRPRRDPEKAERVNHRTSRVPISQKGYDRHNSSTDYRARPAYPPVYGTAQASLSSKDRKGAENSRPSLPRDRPSETENFLSLIPKSLPPQTTALLLAELAKPVSEHDEAGFIYMFWLTDAATSAPEPRAASSLLTDNLPSTPNGRRKSDFMQAHQTSRKVGENSSTKNTILLKIGRASNVQRRMNEWTRQCGQNLSLIRFYPHVRSSSPINSPLKVPHSHKVERLIHIELAEQRVKRDCDHCGKEHREWFEVESSRDGLRRVDETIRRWSDWGQRAGARTSS